MVRGRQEGGTAAILMVLAMVGGIALTGCIGFDGSEDDGQALDAMATDGPGTERDTTEANFVMPFSSGHLGVSSTCQFSEILDSPPGNLTGTNVELAWSTPTRVGSLGDVRLMVSDGQSTLDATSETDDRGILVIQLNEATYSTGPLWIGFCADPTDGAKPNIVVAAEVHIAVTTFTHGPPDWSFSAFDG